MTNNTPLPTIGIVGAGKLGTTLAQLFRKANYPVLVSHSGKAEDIRLTVEVLIPGATAVTTSDLAKQADIIILALPLGKFHTIPRDSFDGKLVIDSMNYWWEVDGPRNEILPDEQSSSRAVQEWFTGARVVKALSHMAYHDLRDTARPQGDSERKAIAIASDSKADEATAATLVNAAGFDQVMLGSLDAGSILEPGNPGFGVSVGSKELHQLLDAPVRS